MIRRLFLIEWKLRIWLTIEGVDMGVETCWVQFSLHFSCLRWFEKFKNFFFLSRSLFNNDKSCFSLYFTWPANDLCSKNSTFLFMVIHMMVDGWVRRVREMEWYKRRFPDDDLFVLETAVSERSSKIIWSKCERRREEKIIEWNDLNEVHALSLAVQLQNQLLCDVIWK